MGRIHNKLLRTRISFKILHFYHNYNEMELVLIIVINYFVFLFFYFILGNQKGPKCVIIYTNL